MAVHEMIFRRVERINRPRQRLAFDRRNTAGLPRRGQRNDFGPVVTIGEIEVLTAHSGVVETVRALILDQLRRLPRPRLPRLPAGNAVLPREVVHLHSITRRREMMDPDGVQRLAGRIVLGRNPVPVHGRGRGLDLARTRRRKRRRRG
ncbi:hypothetical protein D3C80_1309850 [compost metagenome]